MRRFLKWFGICLLSLILIVLMFLAFLLYTQWGARFALDQAAGFVPGELEIAEVEGSLAGPLTLRGISYANAGLKVDAKKFRLDLDISALLGGTARVEVLGLQDATIQLPPPDPEAEPKPKSNEPFALPEINLPIAVEVVSLQVKDVRVVPYEGEPVVIQFMALNDASFEAGALNIDSLNLETSLGYVRLAGSVDTLDAYATDLDLQFGWRRKDALIEGELALQGDVNQMLVKTKVGPPVRLQLAARLEDLLEDLTFSADVTLAGFEAAEFGVDALPGPVEANLEIDGGLNVISLKGAIASGERRFVIEALEMSFNDDRIALDTLQIQGAGETHLSASGTVGLGGAQPVVNLQAQWRALSIPLAPGETLQSPTGEISVTGTLADYQAKVGLSVTGAVPTGQWQLQGHGSTEAFTIVELTANTLDGVIRASGRASWVPILQWQLQLNAEQINPAPLAPQWPGHLTLALQTEGTLTDAGPQAHIQLAQLSGELRGRAIAAHAEVQVDSLKDIKGELYVSSGDSQVSAQGHYGTPTDVQLNLDISQFKDFYPQAAGSVQGEISLTGNPGQLRLTGTLQGQDLQFAGNQIGEFQTELDIRQAASARSELHVVAQAIQAAGRTISDLNLDFVGTRADHKVTLTTQGPAGELELVVTGGLREQMWEGAIQQLQLASDRAGRWQLQDPSTLKIGPSLAALEQSCLMRTPAPGSVCVSGRRQPQKGIIADLTLDQLPLAAADSLIGNAFAMPAHLEGILNGEVHVETTPGESPKLVAHLQTQDAALVLKQEQKQHRLTFNPLRVDAALDNNNLEAELELIIEELGQITASLRSPSFKLDAPAASPLHGALNIDINTLKPLAPLIGPLVESDGRIAGQITLDGTLNAVRLGGEMRVREFTTRVPAAGLHLTDGRVTLSAAGQRLAFEAEVSSGEGQLGVNGEASFPDAAPVQVRAQIDGERFLAADLPGIHVVITPSLDASVDGNVVRIGGTVKIPEMTIKAGEIEGGGPKAVGTSPDVILVGTESEEAQEGGIKLYTEIDVILGEDIEIQAPGFGGGADGRLHVSVKPGQPALGSGELQVTGTYQAYGQDLTITQGRLFYSDSPLDNPGLQIAAVRVVDDVTAGVRISGTVKQPRIELFSDPPLGSDAQILSYIVLGKPLNAAGGGEGLDLRRKATLKGAGLLAQQIGAKLGLDNVSVEETAGGTSVLSIGRYLSPRLYISYGMGILEPVTIVKLEYELSDLWTLETTAGIETRAGIKFEYEN